MKKNWCIHLKKKFLALGEWEEAVILLIKKKSKDKSKKTIAITTTNNNSKFFLLFFILSYHLCGITLQKQKFFFFLPSLESEATNLD